MSAETVFDDLIAELNDAGAVAGSMHCSVWRWRSARVRLPEAPR
jgi:hypothetical protein